MLVLCQRQRGKRGAVGADGQAAASFSEEKDSSPGVYNCSRTNQTCQFFKAEQRCLFTEKTGFKEACALSHLFALV